MTAADVVVAAGDIDLGANGVDWLKRSGKPTVYVAGNHEYYGGEVSTVQDQIRAACIDSEVHFLECDSVELSGVRFLGATLWTDFMGDNVELMRQLQTQMNDYQQIRFGERLLEPEDLAAINRSSCRWLADELATPYPGPTVVVTHHAPLFASWQDANHALFKGAYCNELSELISRHQPELWFHGHIHHPADYHAGRSRVLCNPRGYDGYQLVDGFDPARTVNLETKPLPLC